MVDQSLRREIAGLIQGGDFGGAVKRLELYAGGWVAPSERELEEGVQDAEDVMQLEASARICSDELEANDLADALLQEGVRRGGLRILNELGWLCQHSGRPVEAEVHYRKAALAGVQKAKRNLFSLLLEEGRLEECLEVVSQLVESGEVDMRTDLAETLHKLGRDSESEIQHRRATSEGRPDAASNYALFLHSVGRSEEAEKLLRDKLANGDTDVYFALALVVSDEEGRYEEALDLYGKAEDWQSHLNMALLLWDHKRFDEAQIEFARAMAAEDATAGPLYNEFLEDWACRP